MQLLIPLEQEGRR
jgi:hypothetical protein